MEDIDIVDIGSDCAQSIALYCRVSTDEQAREGVSLEEQQERLKAYCRAMGWTSDVILYVDDGYSAKSTDRPQLTKLLDDVRVGRISKVMVTKLDRMSRRLLDLLTLIELFQRYRVSFNSISESFDTHTPSGRLTLQVLGAVAEFERERIRERVLENMLHAAARGRWLTRSPYGYTLENKDLIIHPLEAKIVQTIYEMYLDQGMGYYAIAKKLNEQGMVSGGEKEWSVRSIKLVLKNPAYKGTLEWNRRHDAERENSDRIEQRESIVVEDCLPAIIDKEIWERVQRRMHRVQLAPRARTSPHLLGGLVKCGRCGSGMSIGYSGSVKNRYRVYRCSANKNKGKCISKQYRADEVEAWFMQGLELLSHACGPFRHALRLSFGQEEGHGRDGRDDARLKASHTRYKRKVEAYASGLIELTDLRAEKQRLATIIAEHHRRDQAESVDADKLEQLAGKLQSAIATITGAVEALPVEEAKALLQTLIESVTVKGEEDIEIGLREV